MCVQISNTLATNEAHICEMLSNSQPQQKKTVAYKKKLVYLLAVSISKYYGFPCINWLVYIQCVYTSMLVSM